MTQEQYTVMVDDNKKLVFPTAEELSKANPELGGGALPDNIIADSFIVGDPTNPGVKISNAGVEVKYLGNDVKSKFTLAYSGLYRNDTIPLLTYDGTGLYSFGVNDFGMQIAGDNIFIRKYSNETPTYYINLNNDYGSYGHVTVGNDSNYIKIKNIDEFSSPINSFYLQSSTLKFATDNIKGWYIQNIYSETVKESNKDVQYIYLAIGDQQQTFSRLSQSDSSYDPTDKEIEYANKLSVNDVLTIFNYSHQHACMYVVEIKPNGIIKCKWILYEPFNLVEDNDNQFINYAVYIAGVNYNTTNGFITSDIQKSTCGVINLTQTSMNLGEGNLAGGFGTIAAGHDNIVNGWYSSAFGKGHQVNSYASGTFGRTNTINSANFCFSAGQSNNITGSQDITVLAGYDIPNGDGNAVFGRINRCKNSIGCGIFGIDNNATSSITSLICGVQNSANGGYNLLVGQSNKIKSSNHNAVIGINNEVTGPRSFAIGQSLIGKTEQLVIGKYNVEDVNAAFIIGRGTNGTNRKNIFTVSKTGEVNITNENSETVTISVAYFKSLEARLAALENPEVAKLRIKDESGNYTDEYCTVEATKDNTGKINLNIVQN